MFRTNMNFATRASQCILVIDDEPHLVRAVRMYLELHGYAVVGAQSGEEALEVVRDCMPDLIILDVMLPGLDGFETLRELRQVSNVPVMMLTSLSEEGSSVRGLRLGADDYLVKPFRQQELVARVQALLRRAEQPAHLPKTCIQPDRELSIDFDRGEVWLRGKAIHLTATEYRLLYHLASNAGRLMSAEVLLGKVWGYDYRDEGHYVRLYISYLRQKLEPDPTHPRYILTMPGLGYKFVDYHRLAMETERSISRPTGAEPS
jgi:two-component system, OmpR family, KDP operon response regulator KdpE